MYILEKGVSKWDSFSEFLTVTSNTQKYIIEILIFRTEQEYLWFKKIHLK